MTWVLGSCLRRNDNSPRMTRKKDWIATRSLAMTRNNDKGGKTVCFISKPHNRIKNSFIFLTEKNPPSGGFFVYRVFLFFTNPFTFVFPFTNLSDVFMCKDLLGILHIITRTWRTRFEFHNFFTQNFNTVLYLGICILIP